MGQSAFGGISARSLIAAAVLLAATAIAFAPIFAVLAGRAEPLAPTVTAFWRTALATPVLALLAWKTPSNGPHKKPGGTHRLPWLLLPGAFFAIDLGCWHTAMTHISAGLATVLGNLSVVIVPFGAWLLLREKYQLRYIPATALALLGAVFVCVPPEESVLATLRLPGSDYLLGNSLATGTAFAYAGYQLSIKQARKYAGTWHVMVWSSGTTAFLLLAFNWYQGLQIMPLGDAWPSLAALALVAHCLGQGLIAWSLGKLPAHQVALLLLWQPACSALLAVGLLEQGMSVLQWAGTAVLLLGLAVAQWPRSVTGSAPARPN